MSALALPRSAPACIYEVGDVVKHRWEGDGKFYLGKVHNAHTPLCPFDPCIAGENYRAHWARLSLSRALPRMVFQVIRHTQDTLKLYSERASPLGAE